MEIFTAYDPVRDVLWSDPVLREAYLDAWGAQFLAFEDAPEDEFGADVFGDEAGGGIVADAASVAGASAGSFSRVRPATDGVEEAVVAVVGVVRAARAGSAEQDLRFHQVLVGAAADPGVWVGPDPTLDPAWQDPRGRSVAAIRADRADLAVRSAAADIGARVHLTDQHVRNRAHRAGVLTSHTPGPWRLCAAGEVSEQNMATAATLAGSLPADAPESWAVFDELIQDAAVTLAPGRFRQRARAVRERVHPQSVTERHQRAAADRSVWIEADLDGMAYLTALLPATAAHAIHARLDGDARHLATGDGEARTLPQLRADILSDLLTTGTGTSTGAGTVTGAGAGVGVGVTVNLTIPALTLLGHSDQPTTLTGYGPIDLDTAKHLAGTATEWVRVLTHPITGTILDVERRTYQVPPSLRRWLGIIHPACVFPGCTRTAAQCDMDHRKRWADGGHTTADNLAPLCNNHHRIKDETRWHLTRTPTGTHTWTTPTGHTLNEDPPPF